MARATGDVLKRREGDGGAHALPSGKARGVDAIVREATEIATMAESPRDRVCCKNMAE